ncbi:hypothetical protein J4477_00720 [Candidatus Pacearchaeota archaeon]|nr:hypothetical protein [Candidatus Pacearchaeota archaeon]
MKINESYKGVTKKFLIEPKTIDYPIVKNGLVAVSILNNSEPYFVVGGVATQSYLPSSCRRDTADIDLCLIRPLSFPEFREMVVPLEEFLHDLGYTTEIKKGSRACTLTYTSSEQGSVSIEAPRRNDGNIARNIKRLEREYKNSRKKIIEGKDVSIKVSSPEDIAIPKLVRSIHAIGRYPYLEGYIPPTIEKLNDKIIERRLSRINQMRREAMTNPGDSEIAERLRFKSDLFDIRILGELAGFNECYWCEAEADWNTLREYSDLKNVILNAVTPDLSCHNC